MSYNGRLQDVLQEAVDTFRDYESQHLAKGGPGCEKAERNKRMAEKLEHALRVTSRGSIPSWDDSPSWATHLAQDANGRWTWYEKEPAMDGECWYPVGGGCLWEYAEPRNSRSWKDSCEKQPILRHALDISKPTIEKDK